MQIKKDIPLFLVLALLFTGLLLNARANQKSCTQVQLPVNNTGKCAGSTENYKNVPPLNFITKGIFHIPS